jgi:hypothetical protein
LPVTNTLAYFDSFSGTPKKVLQHLLCVTYDTFFFVIKEDAKFARFFVPGKSFQLLGNYYISDSCSSRKILDQLMKLDRDKYSCLFCIFACDDEKSFTTIMMSYKAFFFITEEDPKFA